LIGMGANAVRSSSPLNGQAAELWEKDMEEYKRLVLARHKTPEELDA
jgi:ubiquitin-conjugating enzyme E2 C